MRTLRLVSAAAMAAVLLASSSTAVAAQSEEAAPSDPTPMVTPISGTMRVLSQDDPGEFVQHDWGSAYMGEQWTTRFTVDDPRLDGMGRSTHNRYSLPGTRYGPRMLTVYTENDGGSWMGTGRSYQDPETTGIHYQMVMEGQDGYEGLTAIIALDQPSFSTSFDVSGAIIAGGLPPLPDAAPTTFETQTDA